MKAVLVITFGILLTILTEIRGLWVWDFGKEADSNDINQVNGAIDSSVKTKNIVIPKKLCTETTYVHVEVDSPHSIPHVYYSNLTNIVTINYLVKASDSFYTVIWQYSHMPICKYNIQPSEWRHRTLSNKRFEDNNFAMDYYYGADRHYRDITDYEESVEN